VGKFAGGIGHLDSLIGIVYLLRGAIPTSTFRKMKKAGVIPGLIFWLCYFTLLR
jgi:hypothetical protein